MTTSAEIRQAWKTYVFEHADILAITSKAYPYEVTEESEKEVSDAYEESKVNFFEYVVTLTESNANQIGGNINTREQTFLVEVRYTKAAGTDGAAFNDIIDALETLQDVAREDLGATWQGLIDYNISPVTVEAPQAAKFNNTDCFRAVSRFTAIKQI